jgi:hypothetical protein
VIPVPLPTLLLVLVLLLMLVLLLLLLSQGLVSSIPTYSAATLHFPLNAASQYTPSVSSCGNAQTRTTSCRTYVV